MTGEVSKRIHERISFQQWQGRFYELQIVSPIPVKGDWLIEGQEIQDDRVIGRTV